MLEEEPRFKFEMPNTATQVRHEEEEEEEEDTVDFEFAFSTESNPETLQVITADELFYNGQILPVYPVFDRELAAGSDGGSKEEADGKLVEEASRLTLDFEKRVLSSGATSSSSSILSETKDLNHTRGAAPVEFLSNSMSAPQSPDRWRKSSSTGSSAAASRTWKLRDLVVRRSRSDGKEKLVVLPQSDDKHKYFVNSNPKAKMEAAMVEVEKNRKSGKGKGEAAKEIDILTAHRIYYRKGAGAHASAGATGNSRRSFLPYRQELLGGLFGNAKHHPI